jgi:hypothetical protein
VAFGEDGLDFLGDGAAVWASQTDRAPSTSWSTVARWRGVEDVGQRRSLGRLSPVLGVGRPVAGCVGFGVAHGGA